MDGVMSQEEINALPVSYTHLEEPGAECKTGRTAGRGTGKGSQCDQTHQPE